MSYEYVQIADGLSVRRDVLAELSVIDTAVFDVDGVLIDVSGSYPVVISEVTEFYFRKILGWPSPATGTPRLVEREDIALFKQAGGFNSDWAVTQAAIRFYLWKAGLTGLRDTDALRHAAPLLGEFLASVRSSGGGMTAVERLTRPDEVLAAPWDQALIERLCEEHYGGEDWCPEMFGYHPTFRRGAPGLFNLERPLIDPAGLAAWPGRIGIYTGRIATETGPALKLCGLDGFLGGLLPREAVVTASDGFKKPDPGGLVRVAAATGARRAVFCGDNIDDWLTVENYRRTSGNAPTLFIFAGILGGTLGSRAEAIFREKGAEVIAGNVNLVIRHLAGG